MSVQTNPKWDNNDIQFPRLIAELQMAGAFTPEVMESLKDSMDLEESDIDELMTRADVLWDQIKDGTTDKKTYLCIEHGEEFLIEADDIEEARESASLYGGEVIREIVEEASIKPLPADALTWHYVPGWRYFTCEECGLKWRTTSRDCKSPSIDDCPDGCDDAYCIPERYEEDRSLKTSSSGNLLFPKTERLGNTMEKVYEVEVGRNVTRTLTIKVRADNEDEAWKLAKEEATGKDFNNQGQESEDVTYEVLNCNEVDDD